MEQTYDKWIGLLFICPSALVHKDLNHVDCLQWQILSYTGVWKKLWCYKRKKNCLIKLQFTWDWHNCVKIKLISLNEKQCNRSGVSHLDSSHCCTIKTNINILTIVSDFFYSKTSIGAIFTCFFFYSPFHRKCIQSIFL